MMTPGEMIQQISKYVFSLSLVGHRKCDPDWYHKPRQQPFYSMWIITKGRGEFIVNDTVYPVEPGKLFFFHPNVTSERKTDPDDPLEYYFVRFSFAAAYKEKEKWYFEEESKQTFPLQGMYSLQNTPEIINLMEQLMNIWIRRGSSVGIRRCILFQEILLSIIQDFRSQQVAGNTMMAIEQTIDYMVIHYKEALSLGALSYMAGLSVSHYSRLFKKYTGYSPIDYLTHLRMDRAKELIILSDYRLKSIAQSVGYQDEFYFSRIFKKVVGISPTEFAKRHKTKENILKRNQLI